LRISARSQPARCAIVKEKADARAMTDEVDLPDELYGFGDWLLWMVATRATALVDGIYERGPARPSRQYGMAEGHHVPTPSLIAWLLTAAELGLSPEQLAAGSEQADHIQKSLRTRVSRALSTEPSLFKDAWLRSLAAMCGFNEGELNVLQTSRAYEPVFAPATAAEKEARYKNLRTAISRDIRSQPAPESSVPGMAAKIRSLPWDVPSFTGRHREMQRLMDAASASAGPDGVVGVHVIGGMAGIGKTAVAVHAAHQLAPLFPDGQVFLSLHGHTPGQRPVDPADALASLLLTMGVPVARIPADLDGRMTLWRDRLAGRRLLLLLDDAAHSDQVRPLLPGSGGNLVLITSRRHLPALDGVTTISLDTLPAEEAAALLIGLAARPELSPADPAVRDIARLCGYLPLAIGMLARQLHHHPRWSPTERAAELAAARDRLRLMTAENLSVAAAFDLSYDDLSPGQQQLFRRLGLHLGADIDTYAAAALDGTDTDTARQQLEALYDQYLLMELAHGRYQPHDLIRQHARTLAEQRDAAADRDQAITRLLDYYQHTAALAEAYLARQTRAGVVPVRSASTIPVPPWADSAQALTWARTERANLLACLDHVTRVGDDARVAAVTAAVADLLRQDGPWTVALERHAVAVEAARRLGDRAALAGALNDLGIVRWLADDPAGSAEVLQEALTVYRDLGDRLGQANALTNLGHLRQLADDQPGAAEADEQALDIYRDLGDRLGQANALTGLGIVRRQTADYPAAAKALEQALDIYRGIADRPGQVNALANLGIVRWQSDDYAGAAEALEKALDLSRVLGDRLGESNSLTNLGVVLRQRGEYQRAAEALETAAGIFRDIGSRLGEAAALTYLGTVWHLTGDYHRAAGALEESLGIFRELQDRNGQATALLYLGVVRRDDGEYRRAEDVMQKALVILREIRDRAGEVQAFNEMGALERLRGNVDEAEAWHRQALDIAGEIASSWDEGHAQAGLGRCALERGQEGDAIALLQQAYETFTSIGAMDASAIAEELQSLRDTVAVEAPPEAGRGPSSGLINT
jgi:tetratricopeptide (TPR) repeat protein